MALIPVKKDPRTGADIMWQDNATGRYYTVNQYGQTVEVDQYGRPIQQTQPYQQPMQQYNNYGGNTYGNPYYNQQAMRQQPQQPITSISGGYNPPPTYGTVNASVPTPSSYRGKTSAPQYQQPQQACNPTPTKPKPEPVEVSKPR